MVGLSGLEPPTSRLSGGRSNRLSYKPIFIGLLALFLKPFKGRTLKIKQRCKSFRNSSDLGFKRYFKSKHFIKLLDIMPRCTSLLFIFLLLLCPLLKSKISFLIS